MIAPQPDFPFVAECFNLVGDREEISVPQPEAERNDATGSLLEWVERKEQTE